MKTILLLAVAQLSTITALCQTPNFLWSLGIGGAGTDNGNALATDSNGNVYLTGDFSGTITFGSTVLSSNNTDGYLAKYNSLGTCIWAVKFGGTGGDFGYGVAVDNSDNVFITGDFNGTATFGATTLVSSGFADLFVAKLDSSGNWLWSIRAGGTSGDQARGVACDGFGNVYITGHFNSSPSNFGTNNIAANGTDIFVAKANSAGVWQWAVKAGGINNDYGKGIAVNSLNQIVVSGYFYQSMTYGISSLTSAGWDDAFVAKLDSNGAWLWGVRAGGIGTDESHSLAIDSGDNIYICGNYGGTATFGGTSINSQLNSNDIYCAKLNTSGAWHWVRSAGGTQHDFARGVAVGSGNHIYVTGWVQGTSSFGTSNYTTIGFADAFVAKISSGTNNWEWVVAGGSVNNDNGLAIATAATDIVYSSGGCASGTSFGSFALPGQGLIDAFLNKISDNVCASTNIQLQTSVQQISCAGAADGIIEVIPTGGTGNYTFLWAGANPPPGSGIASSLAPGQYTAAVIDANNCTTSTPVITITEPPPLVSNLTSIVDWVCHGKTTGEATYDTQGGTPPYTWLWNTSPAQTTANIQGLPAGTYQLTTTDDNNCTTNNTLVIQSYPQIIVTVTESVGTLSATQGFATYQWFVYNNQVIGATAADYTPNFSGMYHVEVTDANGCRASSSQVSFIYLGDSEIIAIAPPTAYPNPFDNVIWLNFSNTNFNTDVDCFILDCTGKITYSFKGAHDKLQIDSTQFSSGIYTLYYRAANGYTRSILLMKR